MPEIQSLIADEIQESIHLDYKEARAVGKTDKQKFDFAKDVSAFANSDGGVLVYGIKEKGHLPVAVTGIEHSKFTREFFEQTIRTNISQPSPNFTVVQIPINEQESVYSIKVEKSYGTPHQCKENKIFYKRHNFESIPMESYEIDDVRNRRQLVPSLLSVRTELIESDVFLLVSNEGEQIAQDISFDFPTNLEQWAKENEAIIFLEGIKYLSPKQSFRFYYEFVNMIFDENSNRPSQFDISATYFHPLISQKITETFHIDLKGYLGTISYKEESYFRAEKIESVLKELTGEVKKLNENLSNLSLIANPTGLNISHTALRNLRNVELEKPFEKIPIPFRKYTVFQEVLGIDYKLALNIRTFFSSRKPFEEIKNVEGITEKIIDDIKISFILDDQITE